jgi:predicted ATPase
MITRAKFENFKALRDVEITFDSRLTVLVGPNGSGKTSVLQGLFLMTQLAKGREWQKEFTGQFALPLLVGNAENSLQLEATIETSDTSFQVRYEGEILTEEGNSSRVTVSRPPAVSLGCASLLQFAPNQLRTTSLTKELPPTLAPDGLGLASVLSYIHGRDPERFEMIVSRLKELVPGLRRLRFDRESVNPPGAYGDVVLIDYVNREGVRASGISDGTLILLGLLTSIIGETNRGIPAKASESRQAERSPRLVLLDDLDHALHPKAQMNLVELLRKLLDQFPDLQIIATSHSPYILDRLQWNEVRVTALNDDGTAVCKPLTDHPDFERWKESMSPGEFWSTFYEDWLTKTREPQPVP